jgi:hypothetical protein
MVSFIRDLRKMYPVKLRSGGFVINKNCENNVVSYTVRPEAVTL